MSDETTMQTILTGTLRELWELTNLHKDESEELSEAYALAKHGIHLTYHIMWNINNLYNERTRTQEIELNGTIYNIEDWWDEETERKRVMRHALHEHFSNDESPYTER